MSMWFNQQKHHKYMETNVDKLTLDYRHLEKIEFPTNQVHLKPACRPGLINWDDVLLMCSKMHFCSTSTFQIVHTSILRLCVESENNVNKTFSKWRWVVITISNTWVGNVGILIDVTCHQKSCSQQISLFPINKSRSILSSYWLH